MSYARGGYLPPQRDFSLDPEECVLDRRLRCTRTDDAHHRSDPVEVRRLGDAEPSYIWGPCIHRHVVPVESSVDGEIIAHLCLHCDAQLP